jgi:hypothetical protein
MEKSRQKVDELTSPTPFQQLWGFLGRWGSDILDVFEFILRSVGNIFASMAADIYLVFETLIKLLKPMGARIWGILTFDKTLMKQAQEDFTNTVSNAFSNLEFTGKAMIDSIRQSWNDMISDMEQTHGLGGLPMPDLPAGVDDSGFPEQPGDGASAEDFESVYGPQLENFQAFLDYKYELQVEDNSRTFENAIDFNARITAAQKREDAIKAKEKAAFYSGMSTMTQNFYAMSQVWGEEFFLAYQAMAISETIIATHDAAMKSYAWAAEWGGPPAGLIAAGIAVAAGLARIDAIASQSPGGVTSTTDAGSGGYTGGYPYNSPLTESTPAVAPAAESSPIHVEKIVIHTERGDPDEIAERILPALERAKARWVH